MKKTIVGLFGDTESAERMIKSLQSMGLDNNYISYATRDKSDSKEIAKNVGKDVGAGAATGATTGGIIGAVAGLAVANGILPGLGTLFVAGPLAAALGLTGAAATTAAGAMTGAAAGGLIGALGGMGMSDEEARSYESRIKEGDTLVAAQVDEAEEPEVKTAFDDNGAEEVRSYSAKKRSN